MITEYGENLMKEYIRMHEPIVAMSITFKGITTLQRLLSEETLRLLHILGENEITVNTNLNYQNKCASLKLHLKDLLTYTVFTYCVVICAA